MNFSSPKISGFSVFTRPFGDVFNLPTTSEEVQTRRNLLGAAITDWSPCVPS